MNTEPQIEPVTDDDLRAAQNIGERPGQIRLVAILEQDRRRVAERQAPEIERLRAEVAAHRKHDVLRCDALMKAEAEVAKLNAACAAKDAALRDAQISLLTVGNDYPGSSCYEWCMARAAAIQPALSTDASRNWIDATGAVEAVVSKFPAFDAAKIMVQQEVPDEWAGSPVVIVRKP